MFLHLRLTLLRLLARALGLSWIVPPWPVVASARRFGCLRVSWELEPRRCQEPDRVNGDPVLERRQDGGAP